MLACGSRWTSNTFLPNLASPPTKDLQQSLQFFRKENQRQTQQNKSDRKITLKRIIKKLQIRSSNGGNREKIRQNAVILDAIAEFLNIKGKREQEELHFNVPFAAKEESAEGVVLFENAESTFDLNGAVDAEQNPFIADDIVKRLAPVL